MRESFSGVPAPHGWIEVIVGCMFSGKTEELMKQVRRAQFAKQKTQLFKPSIDSRYSHQEVCSHDQNKLECTPVSSAREIFPLIHPTTTVIGIDEAQFFNEDLITLATVLADSGKRVIIAGLDTDWRARPFGPMPHLMAIAELVHKQHAICRVCGGLASRTQRTVAAHGDILVGSTESYEARCRKHFDPDLKGELLTDDPDQLILTDLV